MRVIGVTEDLIQSDGRPRHPAVDFAAHISSDSLKLKPIEIPQNRCVAAGTTNSVDILVLGDCSISQTEIRSGKRTRMICRFGKGYDDIDVAAATACGIVVTRVVTAGESSMATGVMALILVLSTRFVERFAIARDIEANWDAPLAHGAIGLKGKVLGIVGYGRIGQEVANRARSFGMKVIYYDPYQQQSLHPDAKPTMLDDLMSRSDIISVNCPLTPETRGLISPLRISLMKSSAYIINTGRGAVVDEAGLCLALQSRHIAGAALDVFAHEPLPAESPLRLAPNLIITPHAIGVSDEMYAEYLQSVMTSINQFLAGSCPSDSVNAEAFKGH